MFSDPEKIQDIIDTLTDRQWDRLFKSKEKADTFLAKPEEVAVTAEVGIYRAIRDDLMRANHML
jgi:hypothetical protein